MRRYDDPVEVRRGGAEMSVEASADSQSPDPDQFLWRGRLWQVREVVSHWVETGTWWSGPSGAGDGLGHEVWRVRAVLGRLGERGVFDLALTQPDGRWLLARAAD